MLPQEMNPQLHVLVSVRYTTASNLDAINIITTVMAKRKYALSISRCIGITMYTMFTFLKHPIGIAVVDHHGTAVEIICRCLYL